MNKKKEDFLEYDTKSIFIRYILIVFFVLFYFSTFFSDFLIWLFTKIAYFFLSFFTTVVLDNNILILSSGDTYEIVLACIAVSSYVLITLIFLSLPIKKKILLKSYIKAVLLFTFINLSRILFLMFIHFKLGQNTFDGVHTIFYKGVSGIITALVIILFLIKIKVKKLYPFLSDIKWIIKEIKK